MAGCHHCEDSNVECDYGLPSCSTCSQAGKRCRWGVRLKWASAAAHDLDLPPPDESFATPPSPNRYRPTGNALARRGNRSAPFARRWDESAQRLMVPLSLMPDATPTDIACCQHFMSGVAPTLVALEMPSNPNYYYIPISLASRALFHALVATGAAHSANWEHPLAEPTFAARHEQEALGFLQRDVEDLQHSIAVLSASQVGNKLNAVLATLQILVLLASTTGDRRPRTWRRYLEGAGSLINQCLERHPGIVIDTFLLETLRYYDVQAAIALGCPTVIASNVQESGWEAKQLIKSPLAGDLLISAMHGFTEPLLRIAGRIANLRVSSSPSSTPSPPSDPDFPSNNSLTRDLTASLIFSDLETYGRKLSTLHSDATFRALLLQRLPLGGHAEHYAGHFRFAEALLLACHVFLERTMSRTPRLGEQGRRYVLEGVKALEKVPWEGSSGNLLGWALVILGSELEKEMKTARALVRLRLGWLAGLGYRNLVQTVELVEEVWRRMDGGEVGVSWQQVIQENGWELLVV
ncbi:fungal-specific transcription factor domain-domain-containing protein [Leucosporidium creatinivorum]|uniref:Fungal-specific transcription factor domain-domain-containing protein n=1 Tax=Leucosporidium creatinivorum TaxID=106004 RepID=A0A1Y2FBJ9_9BASI|nr:fungal-specific transcription factor domain-domain-containing protein [Leucosporidium creatinivorum]